MSHSNNSLITNLMQKYYNRDLSWLSFNYRVLEEAKDKSLPLYERIRFLAIYSQNLEEFYKVRVASVRGLNKLSITNKQRLYYNPDFLLRDIYNEVKRQFGEHQKIFGDEIIPELAVNNIILVQNEELNEEQKEFVNNYFFQEILPLVQPVLLAKGNIFSFLQDNIIYIAVRLYKKSRKKELIKKKKRARYAIIKLPTQYLSRFVMLPKLDDKHFIMFIDDILKANLQVLFPGYYVDSEYSIKMSRDADLLIEDEFHGDLVEKIRKSLSKRKSGAPSRFIYDSEMPKSFLKLLKDIFKLSKDELFPGGKYDSFYDFFKFPNPLTPKLEGATVTPLHQKELSAYESVFAAVREKDFLLHFPYQSYDYVIRFLNEAAVDPKVEQIMTTQYRVATNSAIVSALISAARNGKSVTVFVEVKARFDEEMNLKFAEEMRRAGIKIIASIPGIKVHAKVAVALRKPKDGKMRGYAFLSTGNFNEKTAKIYADHGFFTSNSEIIEEISHLFKHLFDQNYKYPFKHLLIAQFNLVDELMKKIDREIANAQKGKKAYIIFKTNSLESKQFIDKLYEASEKGVKIDLINRGICCMVPQRDFSENITVTRIVDKYLEHARVYMFHNDGQNEIYISSADLMNRNLLRRIELAVPIYNETLKNELLDILKIQLADNTKARILDASHGNRTKESDFEVKVRAQVDIYEYLKNKTLHSESEKKPEPQTQS